jgi:hypothetical protein
MVRICQVAILFPQNMANFEPFSQNKNKNKKPLDMLQHFIFLSSTNDPKKKIPPKQKKKKEKRNPCQ